MLMQNISKSIYTHMHIQYFYPVFKSFFHRDVRPALGHGRLEKPDFYIKFKSVHRYLIAVYN